MSIYAVSGSASGMGAAVRQRLEAAGHDVVGIDLRDAEVVCDLSTTTGRHDAVAAVSQICNGTLDGFVSAAGLGPPVAGELIARVNYFGATALLEGLRPALAAAGWAQVVQFGSNSATITPNLPDELVEAMLAGDEQRAERLLDALDPMFAAAVAYACAKLAITRWCRRHAVTHDWAGEGIRLNVIAPGPVDTPLLRATKADEVYGQLLDSLPMPVPETADADTLAAWVEFLLSPAARFACGSVIYVDCGIDAVLRTDDWPSSFTM